MSFAKTFALSAAAAVLAASLFGCAPGSGPHDIGEYKTPVDDGFIYFEDDHLIKRVDIEGRRVSVVCPDPVCTHDTPECPVFHKYNLVVSHDRQRLYFTGAARTGKRDGAEFTDYDPKCNLYMYDLISGEVTLVYENGYTVEDFGDFDVMRANGEIWSVSEAFGYLYFLASELREETLDNGGTTWHYTYSLYRFDPFTGETGKLTEQTWEQPDIRLVGADTDSGRLLWGGAEDFSTLPDFTDREACDIDPYPTFDGWRYRYETDWSKNEGELYRVNGEMGERETVMSGENLIFSASPAGDGFLYKTSFDVNELYDAHTANRELPTDGIGHISFDGQKRQLYKAEAGYFVGLPNDDIMTTEQTNAGDWVMVYGYYISDISVTIEPPLDPVTEYAHRYITLLNVKTGESFNIQLY